MLTPEQRWFLDTRRVAHLATVDPAGMPHVVPVCHGLASETAYIVLDEKPKRVAARALKRVRNILANPRAALVADHYDDADWSRLGWVMLRGTAEILEHGAEHKAALALLRDRYAQYRAMSLNDRPIIALRIERVVSWGEISPAAPTIPD